MVNIKILFFIVIVIVICDLHKRSNWVISDFRVCDGNTLDSLHKTYVYICMGASYET